MKLWYIGVGNKNRTVATLYMLVDWEACLGWLVGGWGKYALCLLKSYYKDQFIYYVFLLLLSIRES